MITSGSCRRIDRRAPAKLTPRTDLDLHLVDQLELVFDRVFDRDDVAVHALDQLEGRVERRRLAAARGAGDQHQAVGLAPAAA